MKLKPETVAKTVKGWNVLFGGNRKDAELAFISQEFFKALLPVYSDEAFTLAVDMVKKETRFFPTIKEMMDLSGSVQQVRERIANYERLALPEETGDKTPEELEQEQERLNIILLQLQGALSMDEALERQSKLTTYARGK